MSFNWFTLLTVAGDLLEKDGEEYMRTSINRSYYAVFNTTRQIIEENIKEELPVKYIHDAVINYCISNSNHNYQKIGSDLDRLRRERVKADYKGDIVIKKDTAQKVFKWAKGLKPILIAFRL